MKTIRKLILLAITVFTAFQLVLPGSANTSKLIYRENFEFGKVFYEASKFWSTSQSITDYTTDPNFVISSRKSLKYQLTNLSSPRPGRPAAEQIPGWRDLGGTSGNKMNLSSNKTYTIRMNFKLINIVNFVVKIRDIAAGDPERCFVKVDVTGTTPEIIDSENPAATSPSQKSLINHDGYSTLEFTYTAGSNNTYAFFSANGTVAGGSVVVIDDFVVCEGESIAEENTGSQLLLEDSFENGLHQFTPWITSAIPTEAVSLLTSSSDEVINGSYSLIGGWDYNPAEAGSIEWCAITTTKDQKLKIEASTRYTVQFRYKVISPAKSFFYCMLDSSVVTEDIYLGFNNTGINEDFVNGAVDCSLKDENDYKVMTVTFDSAATADGYTGLTFGAKGGGTLILDDIRIYKGLSSSELPALVKTAVPEAKLLIRAGFETGTTGKYFFNEPLKNTDAIIVNDMESKINGYCSALLYARYDREWSEILRYNNNPDKQGIPFKAKTKYTVTFRYKSAEKQNCEFVATGDIEKRSMFYLISKPDNKDGTAVPGDNIYMSFYPDGRASHFIPNGAIWYGGIEKFNITDKNGYYEAAVTFTTGNRTDYGLNFGIKGSGAYLLDDIQIFQGDGYTALTDAVALSGTDNGLIDEWFFKDGTTSIVKPAENDSSSEVGNSETGEAVPVQFMIILAFVGGIAFVVLYLYRKGIKI